MSTNTYTIAVLKAKPGKAGSLISILERLAGETRKEAGAVEYGFIQDQMDQTRTCQPTERLRTRYTA